MDEWHSFCDVGGCPFTTKLIYLYDRTIRIGQELGMCSCGLSRRRLKRLIKSLNTDANCLEDLQRLMDESGGLLCRYLREYLPKHGDGFSICNVFSVIIAIETIVESLGVSTTLPLKAYKTELRSLPSFYVSAPSTWKAATTSTSNSNHHHIGLFDVQDELYYRTLLDKSRMKLRQCIADKDLLDTFNLLKEKLNRFSVGDARSYRLNHALPFIALLISLAQRRFRTSATLPAATTAALQTQVALDHLNVPLTISQAAALMLLGHSQNHSFIDQLFNLYKTQLYCFLADYDHSEPHGLPLSFPADHDYNLPPPPPERHSRPDLPPTGRAGPQQDWEHRRRGEGLTAPVCDCQRTATNHSSRLPMQVNLPSHKLDSKSSPPTAAKYDPPTAAKYDSPRLLGIDSPGGATTSATSSQVCGLPAELLEQVEALAAAPASRAFEVLELAFFESSPVTRCVIPLLLLDQGSTLRSQFRPSLVLKISLIIILHNALTEMQSWLLEDYKIEACRQFIKYKQFAFSTQQDRVQRQVIQFMHRNRLIYPRLAPQWSYLPVPPSHSTDRQYVPAPLDTHSPLQCHLDRHNCPHHYEAVPDYPSGADFESTPDYLPGPDYRFSPSPSLDYQSSPPSDYPFLPGGYPNAAHHRPPLSSADHSKALLASRHAYQIPRYSYQNPNESQLIERASFFSSSTTCCSYYQPTPPLSYSSHSLAIDKSSITPDNNPNNYQVCTILWAPTPTSQYVVPGIPYHPPPNTTINFQIPLKCNDLGTAP